MASQDKKYLQELAREIKKVIKEQLLPPPFLIASNHKVYDNGSDGWAIKIGVYRGYKCSVEIWLDRFPAHQKRKVYYCIVSHRPEGIKQLVTLAKRDLGNHISIYKSDWSVDEEVATLSKPLGRREFGRPLFERYPKDDVYLYGIYEYEKLGLKRNETRRLIERVVYFVVTINEALSKEQIRQEAEVYQAVENRKAVQKHLLRERKGHLVTLRKQLDNYVCQICGFDFRKKYGSLGDDFAEAHHIIPLGKDTKKRITNVEDLITVCANCHRMLHKMKGRSGDMAELKAIIRKQKSPGKKIK